MSASINRRALLAAGVAAPLLGRVAPARAETRLRLGVLRLASSAPVFLAQDLGYFRDAGLDVELVFFDAAQPVAVAAASGDIDLGVTGLTAGLYNLAGKRALGLIAGQSRETKGFPLEAYLATPAPAGAALKSLADIRGHSLGITQVGSSFHYAAGLIADKFGFPLSDIRFVPLQSMGNIASALKGGRVQAAILPATSAQSAIEGEGARLIGWGSDEVSWQVGAAFASARTKASKETIDAFLAAYKHGCATYHDTLVTAVSDNRAPLDDATTPLVTMIAKYCNQLPERIARGLSYVDREGALDLADLSRQIAWYQRQGFVDGGFGFDAVLDGRFVRT